MEIFKELEKECKNIINEQIDDFKIENPELNNLGIYTINDIKNFKFNNIVIANEELKNLGILTIGDIVNFKISRTFVTNLMNIYLIENYSALDYIKDTLLPAIKHYIDKHLDNWLKTLADINIRCLNFVLDHIKR